MRYVKNIFYWGVVGGFLAASSITFLAGAILGWILGVDDIFDKAGSGDFAMLLWGAWLFIICFWNWEQYSSDTAPIE